MDAALFTLSTLDTPQMCDGFQHWHSCVTAAAGQATQPNPRFIKMRHDPLHIYICLNDQEYEGHVGLVGGPAQRIAAAESHASGQGPAKWQRGSG